MNALAPDPSDRWSSNALRTVVTTVKNEAPFLLEWLCYHRLIGFNRFVIYSNDCTDGTHEMLRLLNDAGLVQHYDNGTLSPDLPEDPQRRAYARALDLPEVTTSDWIAVLDGDEFFHVNVGEGTLDDLFRALPSRTDTVAAQWRIFGNSEVIPFQPDALQITQFRMASPKEVSFSNNQFAVKSLFRPFPVQGLGVHRPVFKPMFGTPEHPVRIVNGSGANITEAFLRHRWDTDADMAGYDLCHVNHYKIRSSEVFLMKRWRGTANSSNAERITFDYFTKYNLNVVPETGITRWAERVTAARADLIHQIPKLGHLQAAAGATYRTQIDTLKAQLKAEAPDQYELLFSPKAQRKDTALRQVQLEALLVKRQKRIAAKIEDASVAAALPREIRASPILLAPLTADTLVPVMPLLSMTPWATLPEDPLEVARTRAVAAAEPQRQGAQSSDLPPQWLIDLRRSPYKRGFYHSEEEFAALHVERKRAHLFVTFDNLSQVGLTGIDRDAWGYEFARKSDWSQLGIFAFRGNWFRTPLLFDYLRQLRDAKLFERYQTVTFSGTSMGAYAACAFSSLVPGCQVVAFSPQSTLSAGLVPWEGRFPSGRAADWRGDFSDAAAETAGAGQVFLIYDPLDENDRAHAERFSGDNITHLRAPLVGHKTALRLRQADLLSQVIRGLVTDSLTPLQFRALYRSARMQPWYLDALGHRLAARGRSGWLRRLAQIARQNGRPNVAKNMEIRAHPSPAANVLP
ncbi:glycosyltransferase family 2 protein [Paracoccus gahaiensis]|uniref:Glycosyltransferase family 2 protein n=1 Tax=Paracoccus gahaiensis TaxID=1706839 RepID=A0A4U0R5W9_9RHOB|nr:glycosyltransferase family 2 protein [Paracoccus gahaiensis]TJZ89642.1 glycosyltransferase family 2 protein [Paracoccus gahaiensis]